MTNIKVLDAIMGSGKSTRLIDDISNLPLTTKVIGEMVQWIYRSQIRNGKPITVYVPSRRMRELLIDWLNGKYD